MSKSTKGPLSPIDAAKVREAKDRDAEAARIARNDKKDRDAAEAKARGHAKVKRSK